MPRIKHFIGDISLYQYCRENKLNYNKVTARMSEYDLTPEEAVVFKKQKGYKKFLYSKGITKEHPLYWTFYRRMADGWNWEKAISIPYQGFGGNRRKKLDKD